MVRITPVVRPIITNENKAAAAKIQLINIDAAMFGFANPRAQIPKIIWQQKVELLRDTAEHRKNN
jgi:hypothetical protein